MSDQFIKSRAAVAWGPKEPLSIEEVDVMLPKKGEVLVKIIATGVCHTDAFTLSGNDPEGIFPAILGHSLRTDIVLKCSLLVCVNREKP